MAKAQPADLGITTTISNGSKIIGDLKSNGDIRFDGKIKGNIVAQGKLVVGATGVVEGNITSASSQISGAVTGKISVKEILSLKATANIKGDIITKKLSIEPGAMFSGTCNMDYNNVAKREIPEN